MESKSYPDVNNMKHEMSGKNVTFRQKMLKEFLQEINGPVSSHNLGLAAVSFEVHMHVSTNTNNLETAGAT